MKKLLITICILTVSMSTSYGAAAEEKRKSNFECSVLQGAGKIGVGAVAGGVVATVGTWVAGLALAPVTMGSSAISAFLATPAAFSFGSVGGGILGSYSEAKDCIFVGIEKIIY